MGMMKQLPAASAMHCEAAHHDSGIVGLDVTKPDKQTRYDWGYKHGYDDIRFGNKPMTKFDCAALSDQVYAAGYVAGAKAARKEKREEAGLPMIRPSMMRNWGVKNTMGIFNQSHTSARSIPD